MAKRNDGLLQIGKEKIVKAEKKEVAQKVVRRKKRVKALKRTLRGKERKLTAKKKQVSAKRLLGALGVVGGAGTQAGAGRPRGTYKYGMPIHEYKKLQARKRALQLEYQREQMGKLMRRGVRPEQVQRLQVQRTIEQGLPPQTRRLQDEPEQMVDDELEFRRFAARESLSPSAQAILTRLRRIQNKGKSDNIRQQRIHKERRMISEKSNLFRAHENMVPIRLDMTGVDDETNILMAPSVFKENPENNILRSNRLNLLQSKEAGTNLKF